jgi:hypothetical protein
MSEDKQKKNTRLLIIAASIMLFLFIVVRIITVNCGGNGGLGSYTGPVFDSVKLPDESNKIKEFDDDKRKEEENKYKPEENKDAIFMDFKKAYSKLDSSKADQTHTTTIVHEKPKQKDYSQENERYTPVNYNKKEEVQKIGNSKASKELTKDTPTETQATDPFGTVNNTISGKSAPIKSKDMIRAEVYGDQKIPNGGGIIFRNTDEIIINDIKVPKNSILYGKASYSGDRVMISVTRAKTQAGDELLDLTCFDNDYIEGIFFKAPRDEAIDKTTDDANSNIAEQIQNSNLIVKGVKTIENAAKNTADAIKKDRKLSLEDGYIVYLKIKIKKK